LRRWPGQAGPASEIALAAEQVDAPNVITRLWAFCIKEDHVGRGILLWLLGVPIPIIILIALLYH